MSEPIKVTEQESLYHHLENMPVEELLTSINHEDQKVALAVQKVVPRLVPLVNDIVDKILAGGRLFYIGAGTSGRLGILDASEIPPTYGMPQGVVIAIIAGGEKAIRFPVEAAEDSREDGWKALEEQAISTSDVVIGIAASGTTPFVISALEECRRQGITTACITCNEGSPLAAVADHPIEVVVGPEFVTGSTRMKSGTAQKMLLNMISTAVMIRIGRVEDNRMVNMQLTNTKLVDRGTKMVMQATGISDYEQAKVLLTGAGSVKKAVERFQQK